MKILHYVGGFSVLTETFIYDSICELEKQGVQNIVITHNRINAQARPFEKVVESYAPGKWNLEHVTRYALRALRGQEPIDAMWPQKRRSLKKNILEISPDVIHAHFGPKGAIMREIAEGLKIPLVTSFYGADISTLAKKKRWIHEYKKLANNNFMVTVLSQQMKTKLKTLNINSNRAEIIHLSRDTSKFEFKKPSKPICKFISVGRLTHKKGHFDTIDAFKKLKLRGYEAELEIIGDGILKQDFDNYIKKRQLETSVKLLGSLPNNVVVHKMKKADAFILCSKTAPDGDKEGTPTVLVEAQAMGLPCISTYHAGIPEMIPEKNHFLLAEEANVEEISQRIDQLIQLSFEEIEAVVMRGRKKIEEDFNLAKETYKLKNIYKQLID